MGATESTVDVAKCSGHECLVSAHTGVLYNKNQMIREENVNVYKLNDQSWMFVMWCLKGVTCHAKEEKWTLV